MLDRLRLGCIKIERFVFSYKQTGWSCYLYLYSNMFTEKSSKSKQAVPKGIIGDRYYLYQDSILVQGYSVESGTKHINIFDVKKEHKVLSGKNTGVRFNVETVPKPLRHHKEKSILTQKAYIEKLKEISNQKLEAVSCDDDANLIHISENGFLVVCVTAFAQHLPLGLSPDHIWSLITYAFAKHVDNHAEELRSNFFKHKEKKSLLVETLDSFQMSKSGNPDSGASA